MGKVELLASFSADIIGWTTKKGKKGLIFEKIEYKLLISWIEKFE